MTYTITISGIKLHSANNRGGKYSILAFADVHVDELELSLYGVALTHKPSAGYRAMPPRVDVTEPHAGRRRNAIEWGPSSPLAVAISDRLSAAFLAFGGVPPGTEDQAPKREYRTFSATLSVGAEEADTTGLHRFVGAAE